MSYFNNCLSLTISINSGSSTLKSLKTTVSLSFAFSWISFNFRFLRRDSFKPFKIPHTSMLFKLLLKKAIFGSKSYSYSFSFNFDLENIFLRSDKSCGSINILSIGKTMLLEVYHALRIYVNS